MSSRDSQFWRTRSSCNRDTRGNGLRILFVCKGNICGSPMAEGLLRSALVRLGLGDRVTVDSASTHDWHEGEPPDRRAVEFVRSLGGTIEDHRGRQVCSEDFLRFDLIVAMDELNVRDLPSRPSATPCARIMLLSEVSDGWAAGIPDPYDLDPAGFTAIGHLIDSLCRQLAEKVQPSPSRG